MAEQPQGKEFGDGSPAAQDTATRAGFCQECGVALTAGSMRRVAGGVFCPPCATVRAASSYAGWRQVHTTHGAATSAPREGEGRPFLAALLGFVPGVGAMYNAQYAKGGMHLLVFVVLLALADNVNWVFYWLVWGWVFYQVFDAYHTARARRDLQPLPNPFGWNEVAERFGVRSDDTVAPPPAPSPSFTATAVGMPPAWPGYNPPAPARVKEPPATETYAADNPYAQNFRSASEQVHVPLHRPPTSIPYEPTYMGPSLVPPSPAPLLSSTQRKFPVSAFWLIGLGVLFLISDLLPSLRVRGVWLAPLLLAAAGLWSATRRWEQFRSAQGSGGPLLPLAVAFRGPVLLLSLAFLLTLHFAHLIALQRSWPVLLIVSGGLSLAQRLSPPATVPSYAPNSDPQTAAPPPPVRSTSGTGSYGL